MKVLMEGNPSSYDITDDLLERLVLMRLLTCSTSLFAGPDGTILHQHAAVQGHAARFG